jgi:predicted metal-dependent phosphoesterase TrpH
VSGTIVDMHLHTVRGASDSSLTPEQLIEECQRIGLGGVNISEHDRLWDPYELERLRQESGLFISRGMEVSTDLGHMIVIGLDRYVPGIHRAAELRRVLNEVGGFMFVAHPFRHFFDPVHFRRDGRQPPSLTPEEAARLPGFALVDEIEVANGGCTAQENRFALAVARILGKRGLGSSDAHSTHGLGCFATAFEQPLEDQRELIAELKAGRFYPAEGLLTGKLVPFGEGEAKVDARCRPCG